MFVHLTVIQAVPGGDCITGVTDAGHWIAVFPRPDHQTASQSLPAERVGPRGGTVHAAHHLHLLAESAQQDLRHDPVLAEPDSILANC